MWKTSLSFVEVVPRATQWPKERCPYVKTNAFENVQNVHRVISFFFFFNSTASSGKETDALSWKKTLEKV